MPGRALNTRKRIIGHVIVATGTLDTIMVHAKQRQNGTQGFLIGADGPLKEDFAPTAGSARHHCLTNGVNTPWRPHNFQAYYSAIIIIM